MNVCRVLLRQSAQLHDPSKHAAIDATFYQRSAASRHYCHRINYRVQKLKVTKLVDTASQAVLDVHYSTTREGGDAYLAEQIARRKAGNLRSLAADKGYDKQSLRGALREIGVRPLIKHRILAPYDHAHNARIDNQRYNQRSMTENVNSAIKRSLGFPVRARYWYWFREFREIALCVVCNTSREPVNSTAVWRFNTAYYFTREAFLRRKNRIGDNPDTFEMDKQEAVDIDYPVDFRYAEFLHRDIHGETPDMEAVVSL